MKEQRSASRISTVRWCWAMAAMDSSFVEPYCLPCVNVSSRQIQTRQIQQPVGTQNCLASLHGLDLSNDSGHLSSKWGALKRGGLCTYYRVVSREENSIRLLYHRRQLGHFAAINIWRAYARHLSSKVKQEIRWFFEVATRLHKFSCERSHKQEPWRFK